MSAKGMSQRSNHPPKLLANHPSKLLANVAYFWGLHKNGALWVYSMFPHITQKILTTDTFHWLALIPSSQLSVDIQFEKNNHLVFLTLTKSEKTKRLYF